MTSLSNPRIMPSSLLGSSAVWGRGGSNPTCHNKKKTDNSRRWLQDTSKRKLADVFDLFCTSPLPVSPGLPEVDPTID